MLFTHRNFTRLMFMMMAKVWGVNGGGGLPSSLSGFSAASVPSQPISLPLRNSSTNLHSSNSGKSILASQLKNSLLFNYPNKKKQNNNKIINAFTTLGETKEENAKDLLLNGAKTTLPIALRRLLLQTNQLELKKDILKTFYQNNNEIIIRHAVPEDAEKIRHLENSLIKNDNVKPDIGIEQIEKDLSEGYANALVILIPKENKLIGYVSYTIASSLNGEKILYLNDMCSDLSYKDLPIKMYAELAKMAEKRSDITQTQAIAHSTTTGHSLFPGMEIVSNETFWQLQLNNNELDKILENGMNVLCGTLKSTIYLPGKLGTGDVHYLVKHWEEMNTNDEGKLDKSINLNILTNLLNTGQLGAVTVHLDARPSIISMLFFHGNNYSLWDGQSIWVDRISVSPVHFECHFPNSISAMFGKLVELSKAIGSKRINWTFNEESTNNFGQIMENIGAINMTKNENWYIYRSNKQQISEYLNDGDIRYMKLNEDYKKLTNEWLKKTKNN